MKETPYCTHCKNYKNKKCKLTGAKVERFMMFYDCDSFDDKRKMK